MKSITYRGIEFFVPDYHDAANNRRRTNQAILCGRIIHKPCEICGHEISVAHHEKYDDFLNVRWLCYSDHRILHSLINKAVAWVHDKKYYIDRLNEHPDDISVKFGLEDIERKMKYNDLFIINY